MAKRRRSPALFEVMHLGTLNPSVSPSASPSAQSLPHQSVPFARRLANLQSLAFWRRGHRPPGLDAHTNVVHTNVVHTSDAVASSRDDNADVLSVVAVQAAPRLAEFLDETPQRDLVAAPAGAVHLRVDRDRQRVLLRFSYHGAAITAFAVVVAVTLAFIVGRMNRGPAQAGAQSTEQVKAGAVNVNVGNIPRPTAQSSTQSPPQQPSDDARMAGATAGAVVVEDAQRTNNLNYYVLFSTRDEKQARDAVEVYSRGDVKTTVEKDCPGFSGMYCVVGLTGFSRTSSREAMLYVREVEKITQKFAGTVVHPAPFKWRDVK